MWAGFFFLKKSIYMFIGGGLLKGNTDLQAAQQLNVVMW